MDKESLEEELKRITEERDKYKTLYEISIKEIETIKANQKKAGRKRTITEKDRVLIKLYRCQGQTIKELATSFNCSEGAICNIIKE